METKTEQLEDRFLKLREVMAMCRLSRSSIYGAIRKGQFPAQIKLSERSSAWIRSEVAAWSDARIDAARGARENKLLVKETRQAGA